GATSSNIATITVTVNQKNNSPVLQNITSTSTNELTEFKFTATSTDPDGDAITYSLTPTTTGAVINANTGEFKWTPTEEQGPSTHTFTITVKDTSNATTSQSFTITVNEVNSAPTVPNITLVTDKNISTTTTLLATDSDIPANTIKFATTSNPSNGTATISNNKLTYTPNFNFIGTDIITYKANDGATSSNIATITVTVNQKNVPPIAQNINATTSEETFVAIILKATDSDVPADILTYSLTSNPSHGILSLNNSTTIYTPEINYYGTDSFTYKANDGTGDSNIATVTITISNINDAPTTNNKSVNATVDNSIIIAVPVSDPDPNNTFTTSVVNSPSLGSITAINGLN
ncbi:MAG: Ig-like domain-containing protein, partial [Patescibacteria group bacterium]